MTESLFHELISWDDMFGGKEKVTYRHQVYAVNKLYDSGISHMVKVLVLVGRRE